MPAALTSPYPRATTRASTRDAVVFHAAFAVVCVAALVAPAPALGWRIFGLVVLYNVALPAVAAWRGRRGWTERWAFLVPLSVFLVLPDAFLVTVLDTLDFPDTGGPRLGPVPLAMAGMWTIPLWLTLFFADRAGGGLPMRAAAAAAIGGAILVTAEATLWTLPIWETARGLRDAGPVAVYVIPALFALGAATYVAFGVTASLSRGPKVAAAAAVALFYLGALGASYYLFERIIP